VTYQPLHHKYRPQTFADLVGQEAITATLINAIRSERIAPAYLFTGPRGTGKTSSARILAKSLNCLQYEQPTESPCGQCEVCKTIASGSALDVIEIDAASNTGVDNIREIIERAQFAPVQCRYKVYAIDECHMLSVAAFNALLKTLEEPPRHVVFVLATTDPQRVLPTIISRCQRFDFRRIPLEAMVQHLHKIASQENIDITSDAVTLVAQVAQGGLRDAESLLDQLGLLGEQVTVEKVWDLVGAVPERDLMTLIGAIASNNSEAVLDCCRRLMDRGREPLVVLQNLAGFYRDLLIAKTAPNRDDLVAVTPPTWKQLCKFAQGVDISDILQSQQHLKNSEAQIKNSTQPRLWLEVTLLGLLPSALGMGKVENNVHRSAAPSSSPAREAERREAGKLPNTVRPSPNPSEQTLNTPPAAAVSREQTNSTAPASQPTTDAQRHTTENRVSDRDSQLQQEPADQATPPVVGLPNVSVDTQQASSEPNLTPKSAVEAQQTNLEQVWQSVLAHIQTRSTQTLLIQHGQLMEFNGTVARIGMRSDPLLKMVRDGLSQVEAAFEKVCHSKVAVSFHVAAAKSTKAVASKAPASPSPSTKPTSQAPVTSPPTPEPPLEQGRQLLSDRVSAAPPTSFGRAERDNPQAEARLGVLESKEVLRPSDVSITQRTTTQSQALLEGVSSNFTMAVIEPPMPSKAAIADSDVEQVGKVLENLKQFFEGEIVELNDDFGNYAPVSTQPLKSEENLEEDNESLAVELEEDQEELGWYQPTTPQQWQASELAALENDQIRKRLEALPYDDDGDIPF
jgi:DNA polymerase-3 subunit gamma/tau